MVDSHCHLNDSQFEGQVESEIQRAKSVGVTTIICNGANVESSKKAVELAQKYNGVFATVGMHPEESLKSQISNPNEFLKLTSHKKVVGVGECGLDYMLQTTEEEKEKQRELFQFNLELAKETGLPLVIHCRNAFAEIHQRIGFQLRHSVPIRVQMHCWTGGWEWAKKFLDLGCYLSFGGVVTFKSSHELREVVKQVPADRLLIETDSPYISPEPARGKPNFPANLIYVAKLMAALRSISIPELDKLTTANAYRLFPKLNPPNR